MTQLIEKSKIGVSFLTRAACLAGSVCLLAASPAEAESPGIHLDLTGSGLEAGMPEWQRHFDFSHPQSGIDLFARQIREIASQAFFSHELAAGLRVDAGMSRSRDAVMGGDRPGADYDYRDLFVGLRFHGIGGRAWRLDPRSAEAAMLGSRWYYEAGVERRLTENWSVSVRLGAPLHGDLLTDPNLDFSLGTRYRLRGFDLGLRLIDHGRSSLPGEVAGRGFSLLGSVSRRFP